MTLLAHLMTFLSVLLVAQLIFVLMNIRALPMPGRKAKRIEGRPLVSVLIPVRDEERNIAACLQHVLASDDSEFRLEVIVYDDGSSDATADIVRQIAVSDPRVRLMPGVELPPGWKGKCHACYQLADRASGSWYLMLDADVRLYPSAIRDTLRTAISRRAGLVTGFPRQKVDSWLEKLVVPMMNFVILCHLPIPFVSRSRSSMFAAAHGAFMLFKKSAYQSTGSYEAIKNEMLDDMAMARAIKKCGYRMELVDLTRHAEMRMYHSSQEVWEGYRKNLFLGLGRSYLLLLLLVLGYTALYLLPLVVFLVGVIAGSLHLALTAGTALLLGMTIKGLSDLRGGLPFIYGLLMPAAAACTIALAVSSALQGSSGRGYEWKGRRYV
ncbi:hypothetical protein B9G55_09755 [Saccharibacillus sp. O16]|nr:hypothetical protein B9G55_09755 [Saccharibacillus sp. O16]